ncbi:uncharacterized protein BO97DRAFT_87636 [Aspergillus homomorphus CBS 101889]|uniref:General substrate transporter n=1 Tax=Aspergillus homomorphus (strain CBS 101889) TaxID=1450537 RepID=A0A395HWG8_ASPHC|nr:hypothetical protein BO97DRAFT_87636 [Aspergillus homomorphus CBS 101889]RAL11869.1 hypothetical protein BO97DRAFT_87636 [Aspergillus homomorphus CBS 101889]
MLRFGDEDGGANKHVYGDRAVSFFFVYYVFFGLSFQGIRWLLPVELNSLSMRTKGAALGTATNSTNFMVVEITPVGIQNLRGKFYITSTVFNFAFVPIVYLFYPETANRSLEDIDRFMQESNGVFVHNVPEATGVERPLRFVALENERLQLGATIAEGKMGAGQMEHKETV